jgi:hypothetical protein
LVLYDQRWWTERIKPIRHLSRAPEKDYPSDYNVQNSGLILNQAGAHVTLALVECTGFFFRISG